MTTALQNRLKIKTSEFASKLPTSVNKAPSGGSALKGARKNLFPIERRILSLLADGLSSQGIADQVELSENMVNVQLKYMFAVAGVNTHAGLIAWAFRRGLLT
jgi:DNA-binding NarL/FixJ family response regulator